MQKQTEIVSFVLLASFAFILFLTYSSPTITELSDNQGLVTIQKNDTTYQIEKEGVTYKTHLPTSTLSINPNKKTVIETFPTFFCTILGDDRKEITGTDGILDIRGRNLFAKDAKVTLSPSSIANLIEATILFNDHTPTFKAKKISYAKTTDATTPKYFEDAE